MEKTVFEGEVEPPMETIEFGGEVEPPADISPTLFEGQWTLARITAYGYFTLLAIPLFFLLIGKLGVNDCIDLIKTIAAILSGIVGMVWGFYFYKG